MIARAVVEPPRPACGFIRFGYIQCGPRADELIHDCLRLHGVENARLQRDRGKPRSAPDCRLLDFIAQRCDRSERHRLAAQSNQLQVSQRID